MVGCQLPDAIPRGNAGSRSHSRTVARIAPHEFSSEASQRGSAHPCRGGSAAPRRNPAAIRAPYTFFPGSAPRRWRGRWPRVTGLTSYLSGRFFLAGSRCGFSHLLLIGFRRPGLLFYSANRLAHRQAWPFRATEAYPRGLRAPFASAGLILGEPVFTVSDRCPAKGNRVQRPGSKLPPPRSPGSLPFPFLRSSPPRPAVVSRVAIDATRRDG